MFGDDLIIGGIRLQANRLNDVLKHIESDGRWRDNFPFYVKTLQDVEKALKKIRNYDFTAVSTIFN